MNEQIMEHNLCTDTDALGLTSMAALRMDDCELWLPFGLGAHF